MADPVATPAVGATVNEWHGGTTYPPGSTVRPVGSPAAVPVALTNASFEDGTFTGWSAAAGWSVSADMAYDGTKSAKLAAGYATGSANKLYKTQIVPVVAGHRFSAEVYFNTNNSAGATVEMGVYWYDASNNPVPSPGVPAPVGGGPTGPGYLSFTRGSRGTIAPGHPGYGLPGSPPAWFPHTVDAAAPANAAFAQLYVLMANPGANPVYCDAAAWNYASPIAPQQVFYAVQSGVGKSGYVEPIWPTAGTVNDGTVTWSVTPPGTILWSCQQAMGSGAVEPNWPTAPGNMIRDGSINWVCVTPQVIDAVDPTLPPPSKYVIMSASKIFVLDGDIARFCATMNCTDWTSEANAGFLPIGQRAFGTNPFLAVGVYRSNAVFMNAEGLQMWQTDEDPANMALLDAIPVGCTQHRSIASVNDDMLFLSAVGVRSMGISAGSSNLQAGDVGMPLDPLVKAALRAATLMGIEPIGSYYPALGQYFLAFPDWDGTDAYGNSLFWSAGGKGSTTFGSGNNYTVNIKGAKGPLRDGIFYRIQYDRTSTGQPTLTIRDENGVSIDASQPKNLYGNGTPDVVALSTTWVQYNSLLNAFYTTTNQTRLFVYTMGRTGEVGSWSNYLLQFTLESFCQSGDNLYMRGVINGVPQVFMFDPNDTVDTSSSGNFTTYGCVQWPWLDDGQPGVTKQLSGFDMAVTMQVQSIPNALNYTVEIGYDQTNKSLFTAPYTVTGDTVTGMIYPIQVKAPSFSMRLVFDNNGGWSMQAATLYLTDKRVGS